MALADKFTYTCFVISFSNIVFFLCVRLYLTEMISICTFSKKLEEEQIVRRTWLIVTDPN